LPLSNYWEVFNCLRCGVSAPRNRKGIVFGSNFLCDYCALKKITLSIVVPVGKIDDAYGYCVDSLGSLMDVPDEIILVFDGISEDERPEYPNLPWFRTEVLKAKCGPGRARNIGARRATGDLLVFIDSDVSVPRDLLRRISNLFRSRPSLDAAFGSYDDAPKERNFLSQYRNLLHHYVHQNANEEASTFWAGCGIIRRSVFFDIGGFREDMHGIEDVELGYRLNERKHAIYLCKTLQVTHLKHWSAVKMMRTDFFVRALPWVELIFERRSRLINDLNSTYRDRFLVANAYLLVFVSVASPWIGWSGSIFILGSLLLGFFVLSHRFCFFLAEKRGFFFASFALFWQWMFYILIGLALGIGSVDCLVMKKFRKRFAMAGDYCAG